MTGAASEDAMLPTTFVIAASMTLVFILSVSVQEKLVREPADRALLVRFDDPRSSRLVSCLGPARSYHLAFDPPRAREKISGLERPA